MTKVDGRSKARIRRLRRGEASLNAAATFVGLRVALVDDYWLTVFDGETKLFDSADIPRVRYFLEGAAWAKGIDSDKLDRISVEAERFFDGSASGLG